jgi:hypothetical protein
VYAVLDDAKPLEDYEIQTWAEDPITFAANKSDPDTLHYNEARDARDEAEFKAAMLKEAYGHTDNDNWEVWAECDVPKDQDILPYLPVNFRFDGHLPKLEDLAHVGGCR